MRSGSALDFQPPCLRALPGFPGIDRMHAEDVNMGD